MTKDFGNGAWFAAALENPETHTGGVVLPGGAFALSSSPNAQVLAATLASSLTLGASGISTDFAPEFVGKIVFEPGWGHCEIKAISRSFRARFDGRNRAAPGTGFGVAALLPISDELDLLLEGLAGRGIGRYAAALGPDLATGPDGSVQPIRATQAIAGIELEAHPGSADLQLPRPRVLRTDVLPRKHSRVRLTAARPVAMRLAGRYSLPKRQSLDLAGRAAHLVPLGPQRTRNGCAGNLLPSYPPGSVVRARGHAVRRSGEFVHQLDSISPPITPRQ